MISQARVISVLNFAQGIATKFKIISKWSLYRLLISLKVIKRIGENIYVKLKLEPYLFAYYVSVAAFKEILRIERLVALGTFLEEFYAFGVR